MQPDGTGAADAGNSNIRIVLLNVSGPDQPGLMAMLTSALAAYQVRILDVGQAVIHDELNLGMLVEICEPATESAVLASADSAARALGFTFRSTPVTAAEYHEWVGSQGKPRYIVTVLDG